MFGSLVEVRGVVAGIGDQIDLLLGADLTLLPQQDLLDLLRDLETQARRLPAVDHQIVTQLDERGVAGELAYASTATLLHDLLQVAPAEAKTRVAAAEDLSVRHGLSGQPRPALFAATTQAEQAGLQSAAHVRVIRTIMSKLPADGDREFGRNIETTLAQHAPDLDPGQLAQAGQRLLARLDPDGPEPTEERARSRRGFTLSKNPDGTARVTGQLTAAATAVWDTILDTLAAPIPADTAGEPDDRTPAQRRHDALLDAGQRLLQSGTLPDCGGTPVTVTVTVRAGDLRAALDCTGHATDLNTAGPGLDWERCEHSGCPGHHGQNTASRNIHASGAHAAHAHAHSGCGGGYGTTSHGDLISIPEILTLAAEADIIPVVLNDTGGIIAFGRTRRLASPSQRRALAARDLGCSFPGCTRPPAWCSAHHINAWTHGGTTDLDNLTLLCGHHHREFQRRGWHCHMTNETPHWTPPAWLDPQQTPQTNTAHHIEIIFNPDAARAST